MQSFIQLRKHPYMPRYFISTATLGKRPKQQLHASFTENRFLALTQKLGLMGVCSRNPGLLSTVPHTSL